MKNYTNDGRSIAGYKDRLVTNMFIELVFACAYKNKGRLVSYRTDINVQIKLIHNSIMLLSLFQARF